MTLATTTSTGSLSAAGSRACSLTFARASATTPKTGAKLWQCGHLVSGGWEGCMSGTGPEWSICQMGQCREAFRAVGCWCVRLCCRRHAVPTHQCAKNSTRQGWSKCCIRKRSSQELTSTSVAFACGWAHTPGPWSPPRRKVTPATPLNCSPTRASSNADITARGDWEHLRQ